MKIRLSHGTRQRFRYRTADLHLRGEVEGLANELDGAGFSLNDGDPRLLYVEEPVDDGVDWLTGYKATPAELRCRHRGEFCLEIGCDDPELRAGENEVRIALEAGGERVESHLTFTFDPRPLPLPLDLQDLTVFADIQSVGQAVNGAFDLDREQNLIRSRAPVAPDALLLLGSPHGSQEATYAVRFTELRDAKWLGLADFHAGLVEGVPPRGLKVGWSSAGMAAMSPVDGGRSFIAWGDHSADEREWAVATHPAAPVRIERGVLYRVRHQLCFHDGITRVRYRIWPDGEAEPAAWLCEEQDDAVPDHLPRHRTASFGLFQHMGWPVEWSDILVTAHEPDDPPVPGRGRQPFLKRQRPGAF